MTAALDQSTVETLSKKFSTELHALKELQAAVEQRRAEERAREEVEKAETHAKAARKQEALIGDLLTAQVEEAQLRAKKQGTLNKILAALLTLMTTGGGTGVYLAMQKPTEDQKRESAKPVTESIDASRVEVEARIESNAKKIGRLGEIAIEQQVQLSDGVEFIGDKIDAAHPKTKNKVDRPDSVDAAKKRATKIKKSKGAEALFKEDPTDPFAGL